MKLIKSAQLVNLDSSSISDETREILLQEAGAFVDSGLTSLEEWSSLSDVEKAALVTARKRARTEAFIEFFAIAENPGAAIASLDGGSTDTAAKLQDAVKRAASRAKVVS